MCTNVSTSVRVGQLTYFLIRVKVSGNLLAKKFFLLGPLINSSGRLPKLRHLKHAKQFLFWLTSYKNVSGRLPKLRHLKHAKQFLFWLTSYKNVSGRLPKLRHLKHAKQFLFHLTSYKNVSGRLQYRHLKGSCLYLQATRVDFLLHGNQTCN